MRINYRVYAVVYLVISAFLLVMAGAFGHDTSWIWVYVSWVTDILFLILISLWVRSKEGGE